MNILKKAALGAVIAATSFAASAQVSCNGTSNCTGPATEMIGNLFPSPNGGILINAPQLVSELPCTGVNGNPVVLLPDTHPNYKETYASLLTAFVAGNDVQLQIDSGNLAECQLFFMRIFP